MEKIVENAMAYARELFSRDHSGHDWFHTLRVYKMATTLAEKEGAQLLFVQLGALLHDVDDIKLSPQTHQNKDNARKFLRENGADPDMIEKICHIIDQVSFKGTDSVTPDSLEGMCVQDADRLDAIGAMGIAHAFAFGGSHHRVMHDPEILPQENMDAEAYRKSRSTTVNHFYEKLLHLTELMNTAAAREIAQARNVYMEDFLREFMDEWEGLK